MNLWLVLALVASPVSDPPVAVPQDSLGKAIFTGKGLCATCHGPAGKGTPLAPDLTDSVWLHADGSLASIKKVILEGVAAPKEHPTPMPAKGGAQLTDAEVDAVARYVQSLSSGG